MPPRIAHKQSNELYNVPLGVLSHRGTQANGKQTVHCINHMDYWKVKIYFNMIDHNVNSRRPCYSQVYVQPQLLIESHIRCEFTANKVVSPPTMPSASPQAGTRTTPSTGGLLTWYPQRPRSSPRPAPRLNRRVYNLGTWGQEFLSRANCTVRDQRDNLGGVTLPRLMAACWFVEFGLHSVLRRRKSFKGGSDR